MPDPLAQLKRRFSPTNPPGIPLSLQPRSDGRHEPPGDTDLAARRAQGVTRSGERRASVVLLVLVSALIGGAGVALIVAGESRAAGDPTLDWKPGVMSHYGPPDEPVGEAVACGRGTIPPGVHGGAMRDQPCGTLVVTCLADLSRCVQWRVTDYGPGIASRSHDAHGHTFSAIAPLSRGVIPILWRVRTSKPRCVPAWVKSYWRPAQGVGGRFAPTCGTRAAR